MNYTEIEGKVREATNDDPWGPTGPLMQELAHSTFTYEHFPEVMSMLWRRMLQDNKTNWRRTYKVIITCFAQKFFLNNAIIFIHIEYVVHLLFYLYCTYVLFVCLFMGTKKTRAHQKLIRNALKYVIISFSLLNLWS